MSKTIDQRVVEMQFDNKNFEKNVSTTMSTIDKLKQSLNFSGASKSLESIGSSVKKVDMSGLGSAVEAVGTKFSALEVMGVTALANITNSAVNAGKKMISALTIDPILTGFQEYETQINAVQTILANTSSKGATLTDVNKALDELNTYADQTIYNFTEMTKNIGTFTAAGVDLDKSVTSIKGIANLAAVSGSNAQQASTAMYQLSQALAAGKVQLMDWNSVVNAGMGGEVFQTALKRTAENFGYNVDGMIAKYGSFRESLTKGGWLTAEVLTETLTQLSGAYTEADLIAQGYTQDQAKAIVDLANTAVSAATDVKTFTQLWDTLKESAQSGWTQTWEILVGDFEEAKSLLTELSQTFGDIIGQSADARNTLLYDTMTSNWKKITDGIAEAGLSAEDFKDKVTEIGKSKGLDIDGIVADYGSLEAAFKNGALSSDLLNEALVKMTGTSEEIGKKLTELRGKYKTNEDVIKALTDAGYEYSDIQDLTTKAANGQTIALNDLTDAQLMSIGYTADQVKSIRELSQYAELAGGSLRTFIDNVAVPQGREMLVDVLRVSLRSLIDIFGVVGKAWKEVFPPTTSEQLLGIIKSIREFTLSLRPSQETLDKLQSTFRGLFSILSIAKQIFSALLSPIGSLVGGFGELGGGILSVTAAIGDYIYGIDQSIKAGNSFSVISDIITGVLDGISNAISFVVDSFDGLNINLSSIGKAIGNVFNAIADTIGNIVNWIRKNISAGDIFAGLAGGGLFVLAKKLSNFVDKIKDVFEGFFGKDGDDESLKSQFSDMLGSIHDSLESFQQGIKVASLVGIAGAIALLTSSLRKISEIEPGKIAYSLAAIQVMILELNGGFKSLTKTLSKFDAKGTLKASIAMIAMAEAINILATAMDKISDLSWNEILKGLSGIGVLLLELSLAIKVISSTSGVTLRTSVAMLALAKACEMLSESLAKFSSLSWDEIARGLTAMGGALAELVAALSVLSKVGGFGSLLGGTAILIAVQSLDEIAENLKKLGGLSWEEIGHGLTAMGGALAEFTVALGVLSKVGGFGSLLGGTAILIAVQSLDEISENLKRLGSMAWDEIGRGLTAMGGALLELSAAVGLLGKLAGFSGLVGAGSILLGVQALGDLADALQEFGAMAWDEIGRGLTAMGGALAELALVSGLLGKLTGLSGLIGAGSILLGVQGLGDLADALQDFGSMAWDEIGRGLVAMGGALAELAIITGVLGTVAPLGALIGSGSLLLGIQGLGDLADALKKFGSMNWDEIGRGLAAMGAAMGETALGGLLNTFSGIGAAAIAEVAAPLGDLADSVKKWEGITVPEELGTQLGSLADGITAFTFGGMGANAISTLASPLGVMADSMKKWQGISISETLGTEIGSLAEGVLAFTFGGLGASVLSTAAPGVGDMADAIKKWSGVTIPAGLEEGLTGIANGIKAFSFAFVGGWSISSIKDPLIDLADAVKQWDGVTIPEGIESDLKALSSGIQSFGLAFLGGWSLETIGSQLAAFGKDFKTYYDYMKDVDLGIAATTNAVVDSLVTLSNKLPDNKLFKNETTLDEFGNQLAKFGKKFAEYYSEISTINVNKLSSAINGMSDLINLVKGISGLDFSSLSSFGKNLEKLGKNGVDDFISAFTNSASKVKTAASDMLDTFADAVNSKEPKITKEFKMVIDNVIDAFAKRQKDFKTAGGDILSYFIDGIKTKTTALVKQFSDTMDRSLSSVRGSYSDFYSAGSYIVSGLADGIKASTPKAVSQAKALASAVEKAAKTTLKVRSPSKVFQGIGENVGQGLSNGIRSMFGDAEDTSAQLGDTVIDGISSVLGSGSSTAVTEEVGKTVSRGIADGIKSDTSVEDAMRQALNAANQTLGINSPSKEFAKIGRYSNEGFAAGMKQYLGIVTNATADVGKKAINTLQSSVQRVMEALSYVDVDVQPTIRPVLDLSNVEAGTSRLSALFSRSQAVSISDNIARNNTEPVQNGSTVTGTEKVFQFTQNNYSPKALSRVEIYRQTKNQFSAMERMVNT